MSTNAPIISHYTLAYAGAGAMLQRLQFKWWEAAAVAVAWEIAQRPLKRQLPNLFPAGEQQDDLLGAVVDAGAMLAGWYVTSRLEEAARLR